MGKINRYGQAAILTEIDQIKIKKELNSFYELIFAIALNTAERWGAILQLQVDDCYADPLRSLPRSIITFRAFTRKASPNGSRQTRQIPINPDLAKYLKHYQPPLSGWLFPSPHDRDRHISFQAVDWTLRKAIRSAKLAHKGISSHSTRRTAITRMHQAGIDLLTIKQITGHQSMSALIRYIENDPNRINAAISLLHG